MNNTPHKKLIIDFDDFHMNNHKLHILEEVKRRNPGFVVNMFAIPVHCTAVWIQNLKKSHPWITFCVHGWQHAYNDECKDWTGGQTRKYLSMAEAMGFDKVFKAPGWQISDVVRNAVLDSDFILVDRYFNYPPRNAPRDLSEAISPTAKILLADEGHSDFPNGSWFVHGHIQDMVHAEPRYANGLEQMFNRGDLEFPADVEFMLIKDLFK